MNKSCNYNSNAIFVCIVFGPLSAVLGGPFGMSEIKPGLDTSEESTLPAILSLGPSNMNFKIAYKVSKLISFHLPPTTFSFNKADYFPFFIKHHQTHC